MAIFFPPPPHPQVGPVASTLPIPHAPIPKQGDPPPRYSVATYMQVVTMAWPLDQEPRLGRPNEQRVKIAPLTLVYGTQPTPEAALSAIELAQIVSTWVQTWSAQSAPESAAWNVPPILVSLPYIPLPRLLWTAWESPWIAPPTPVRIVPLTLVYGDQPPPSSRTNAIVAAWVDALPRTQTTPPNAGWNVPVVVATYVPFRALPFSLYAAWQLADPPRLPRVVSVAAFATAAAAGVAPKLILVDGRLAMHLSGILYTLLD